ncbi:MAG: HAMP domain-containing protein [Actinobacteria bacterium]|nr:HAMP domain-containing protein [Actinomycetota bacterium]
MIGRSVLVRLIAVALVVATCSIVATAWLTTRSTTVQIQGDLKRSLEVDNDIYDQLLEYGAAHDSWTGVQAVVDDLAAATGRIIALRSADGGEVLASSDHQASTAPDADSSHGLGAAAMIDPIAPARVSEGLDLTVVTKLLATELPAAAFALDPDEQVDRDVALVAAIDCARRLGATPKIIPGTFGQTVQFGDASERVYAACPTTLLDSPGRRYRSISNAIVDGAESCARAAGISLAPAPMATDDGLRYLPAELQVDDQVVVNCRNEARRLALEPYVAPQALLFLSSPQQPSPGWLKSAGGTRTVLALGAVLLVTIALAVIGAGRILRPIRSLTRAAQRMAAGDLRARVRVRGSDEVARLGTTFNTMADSLERNEAQRKQLVSDVAHELRNPLANVRGYLEAAQDDVVGVDSAFVDSLLEETMLVQHLIDDLQDLALAEAGRLRVHPEAADLAALAEQTIAAHRQQADRAGVSLLLVADEPTPRAVIEVVDTGVGIDPEHLPHLFDRFYRADPSRTRETGGSGLGLAITQYLVHAHGGTIAVTSTVGVGTMFVIELPAMAVPTEVRRPARRLSSATDELSGATPDAS